MFPNFQRWVDIAVKVGSDRLVYRDPCRALYVVEILCEETAGVVERIQLFPL